MVSFGLFGQDSTDSFQEKEKKLRQDLDSLKESYGLLKSELSGLEGEDKKVLEQEIREIVMAELDKVYALAEVTLQQQEAGKDVQDLKAYVLELLTKVPEVIEWSMQHFRDDISQLESERSVASGSELAILAEQIGILESGIDDLYQTNATYLLELGKMGVEHAAQTENFKLELRLRARLMAGRLKKHIAERRVLQRRVSAGSDDSGLSLRLAASQINIDTEITSLEKLVKLMEPLELPVSTYRALLVQSTSDISRAKDTKALKQLALNGWKKFIEWSKNSLPNLLTKAVIFLLIVYVFWLLSKLVKKAVSRTVSASRLQFSHLLRNFIITMAGNLVILLGVLLAVSQVGFSPGPVLAGLGVAGFILGFALQETLGNFAAGLMILFYRPFDEGDMVKVADIFGKVHKMSLVSTTILTIDNQTLIVPNGKIWGDVICNLTNETQRRVDLKFGVAYNSDISHVEKVLQEIVDEHNKILKEPAPTIKVHELGDSSVNFVVRPWVKTEDYWTVYWDLTRQVKLRFDEEAIGIPFPQRDVHHYYPQGDITVQK